MSEASKKKVSSKITLVSSIIAIVSALITAVVQLAAKTCDDLTLKVVLVILLVISCIFFCIVIDGLIEPNDKVNRWFSKTVCIVVFLFFAGYVMRSKCEEPKLSNQTIDNRQTINDNSVRNDNSKTIIYNSNKPKPRLLNAKDVSLLRAELPERSKKIWIIFKKGEVDTSFAKQVFDKLKQLDYKRVFLASASSLPDGLSQDRLTIHKQFIDDDTVFKVTINPIQH